MWGTPYRGNHPAGGGRFIPTHVGNTTHRPAQDRAAPVHPHACGEHFCWYRTLRHMGGSSPRMWGTPQGGRLGRQGRRFIPTHVGNTGRRRVGERGDPVHPHACGEHCCRRYAGFRRVGSSPRMWGTHLPYRIVFKEEKTPRKIYRLILYSVVRSRGWNATNCSPSNNTGCRRLTPRVWNS